MTEKIKNHSVYVAVTNKKGEVSYKHVPLLDVEIKADVTVGKLVSDLKKENTDLKNRINGLEEKLVEITNHFNSLKEATEESFETVIEEITKDKFL